MVSVNQTRPYCVNQMGKTHSKPSAARYGRGTAWTRHGKGMLCVNRPLHSHWGSLCSFITRFYNTVFFTAFALCSTWVLVTESRPLAAKGYHTHTHTCSPSYLGMVHFISALYKLCDVIPLCTPFTVSRHW